MVQYGEHQARCRCLLRTTSFIPVIITDVIIHVSYVEKGYSLEHTEFLTPWRLFSSVL